MESLGDPVPVPFIFLLIPFHGHFLSMVQNQKLPPCPDASIIAAASKYTLLLDRRYTRQSHCMTTQQVWFDNSLSSKSLFDGLEGLPGCGGSGA